MGHLHLGAVMVADDLALMSSNRCDMQSSLSIAERDASNKNNNNIYFKSLKSQWFSGPYMSNTHKNTNIQAYTI